MKTKRHQYQDPMGKGAGAPGEQGKRGSALTSRTNWGPQTHSGYLEQRQPPLQNVSKMSDH